MRDTSGVSVADGALTRSNAPSSEMPGSDDLGRQVRLDQDRPLADRVGVLEHVHQLAHVSGPRVGLQRVRGVRRDALDDPTAALVHRLHQLLRDQRHVARPGPERRQVERHDPQPVHQVGAEAARRDLFA